MYRCPACSESTGRAGFAYRAADAEFTHLSNMHQDVQAAKPGLWTTCPGVGA
jgi:hypothetical protein